jgi:TonB-dependent SusC/RagA subfamily outer membrane receptor
MITFAYFLLQVIISSGVMLLYYWLFLRNKKFHQYNRFYLLALFVLPWFVPLFKIQLLPLKQDAAMIIYFAQAITDNNTIIESKVKAAAFNWNIAIIAAYSIVCSVILIGLIKALVNIYRLLKHNNYKYWQNIYLVFTDAKGTPFSFFKYIFWNNDIPLQSEAGKQMLEHELIHIKHKHSFDKILIQIILIVGWCNPFFWIAKREMNMIHEFIADNKVVKNGDASALAAMLLAATFPEQKFSLTNPFFFSPIKRRLAMITNNKNPKFSYARRVIALPVLFVTVLLFSFRNMELREQQQLMNNEQVKVENIYLQDAPVSTDSLSTEELKVFTGKLDNLRMKKKLNNGKEITVLKNDEEILKKIYPSYLKMSEEQRLRLKVTMHKIPPMQKEVPSETQINSWKNPNLYGLWIDDKHVNNTELNKYQANDFYHYDASKLYGGAKAGRIYSVQVDLYTNKYFKEKLRKDSSLVIGFWYRKPNSTTDTTPKAPINTVQVTATNNGFIQPKYDSSFKVKVNKNKSLDSVLFVINGVKIGIGYSKNDSSINPKNIQSVNILKDESAVKKYGTDGRNGVIEITTKDFDYHTESKEVIEIRKQLDDATLRKKKLEAQLQELEKQKQQKRKLVQDKKQQSEKEQLQQESDIQKKKLEIEKTQQNEQLSRDFNSAVKRGKQDSLISAGWQQTGSGDNKVSNEVEVRPSFPGGEQAWLKYLEKNLNRNVLIKMGAPSGKYQIKIVLTVDFNGLVSGVRALNNPGFGTKEEAERLIKSGPKWIPGTIDGYPAIFAFIVPVTFQI